MNDKNFMSRGVVVVVENRGVGARAAIAWSKYSKRVLKKILNIGKRFIIAFAYPII